MDGRRIDVTRSLTNTPTPKITNSCGKTTQIPQFLLEDAEARGEGTRVKVVVAQPRRIAAIGGVLVMFGGDCDGASTVKHPGAVTPATPQNGTQTIPTSPLLIPHLPKQKIITGVAQRVAEERGESVGGGASSVGYMIRGENKTGANTRLVCVGRGSYGFGIGPIRSTIVSAPEPDE